MKYISFTLNMPNRGSWNGKWSGDDVGFCNVVRFPEVQKETFNRIIKGHYYYYNFGDGWGASITSKEVDSKEAAKIQKSKNGFCGYEWMIDSIIKHDKIIPD